MRAKCYGNELALYLRPLNTGIILTYVPRQIVSTGSHVTWLRNSSLGWWRNLIKNRHIILLQADYLSTPLTLQNIRHALMRYTYTTTYTFFRAPQVTPPCAHSALPTVACKCEFYSNAKVGPIATMRLRDEPWWKNFHILAWQLIADLPL